MGRIGSPNGYGSPGGIGSLGGIGLLDRRRAWSIPDKGICHIPAGVYPGRTG